MQPRVYIYRGVIFIREGAATRHRVLLANSQEASDTAEKWRVSLCIRSVSMSLKPQPLSPVPEQTAQVAKAAFPKGNLFLTLRDEIGTLFSDEQFTDLFPTRGQPAQAPWRLAIVTILQFVENLSDCQAAEAIRSRIDWKYLFDWKYLLGLEMTDPGFNASVLCEFRARLVSAQTEARLFERLLDLFKERGWVKAKGKQRTDSSHVLAAIRVLSRLENIGETMRHALNTLAEKYCLPEISRSTRSRQLVR
jgi:transposase